MPGPRNIVMRKDRTRCVCEGEGKEEGEREGMNE